MNSQQIPDRAESGMRRNGYFVVALEEAGGDPYEVEEVREAIRELVEESGMGRLVYLEPPWPENERRDWNPEKHILQGKEDYVNFVVDYVKMNYQNKISFQEIADKINISRSYLSVLFNQATGRTFLEYVTDYRMKKALELMRQDRMSLHLLAEQVGYEDYAHFSKVFKKRMGVCPKKFCGRWRS